MTHTSAMSDSVFVPAMCTDCTHKKVCKHMQYRNPYDNLNRCRYKECKKSTPSEFHGYISNR